MNRIKQIYYDIRYRVKNIIEWIPILWKDYHCDYVYLFRIMEKKLGFMIREFEHTNIPYEGMKKDLRDMRRCRTLLRSIAEENLEDNIDKRMVAKWGEDAAVFNIDEILDRETTTREEEKYFEDLERICSEELEAQDKRVEEAFKIIKENYGDWWCL